MTPHLIQLRFSSLQSRYYQAKAAGEWITALAIRREMIRANLELLAMVDTGRWS